MHYKKYTINRRFSVEIFSFFHFKLYFDLNRQFAGDLTNMYAAIKYVWTIAAIREGERERGEVREREKSMKSIELHGVHADAAFAVNIFKTYSGIK